ncbi:hypothetical protein KPH14_013139, partial [Odynerus spinipes]
MSQAPRHSTRERFLDPFVGVDVSTPPAASRHQSSPFTGNNYVAFDRTIPSGSTAIILDDADSNDQTTNGFGVLAVANRSFDGKKIGAGSVGAPNASVDSHQEAARLASTYGLCCLCGTCLCTCHIESGAFNNENFVRYLYDYDLFSVPRNYQNCGYLVAYLKNEGILVNSVVVASDTNSLRGPFTTLLGSRSSRATDRAIRSDIRRSRSNASLSFRRTANVIEPVNDFDVRKLFRNLILKNTRRDWLDLKYALQMPSIVVFFKSHGTKTYVPNADIVYDFDLRKLQILSDKKTIGRRLAELTAGFRREFFDVSLPNFDKVDERFRAMLLDRNLLDMELRDLTNSKERVGDGDSGVSDATLESVSRSPQTLLAQSSVSSDASSSVGARSTVNNSARSTLDIIGSSKVNDGVIYHDITDDVNNGGNFGNGTTYLPYASRSVVIEP